MTTGAAPADLENGAYTAAVRASDVVYPRGGVWLYFGWYAVAAAILLWAERAALLSDLAVPVLALGAAALVWMFRSRGPEAFSADAAGLRFWGGTQARRIDLAIPWTEVQELRLRSILGGTLLEVLVAPAATIEYRSPRRQFGDLLRMFFVPVIGARTRVAAVVLPRPDPPRYQVPLLRVRPAELRSALAPLAPGTLIDMAS